MNRIVVGVDGSDHASRALAWSAEEARVHSATLVLVHSWQFPAPLPDAAGGLTHIDIEGAAKQILDDAVATVGPDVKVETVIANESPGQALINASKQADLVVVGARGRGGFSGLLLGSVSQQVAHHAHCPIVIVPDAGAR